MKIPELSSSSTRQGLWLHHARGRSKDVFVHASALEAAGIRSLNEGDKITFVLEDDRKGRGKQAGQIGEAAAALAPEDLETPSGLPGGVHGMATSTSTRPSPWKQPAPFNPNKAARGTKRLCDACQVRFYDLLAGPDRVSVLRCAAHADGCTVRPKSAGVVRQMARKSSLATKQRKTEAVPREPDAIAS